jgi:Holliday junction DNA helicase RuvB
VNLARTAQGRVLTAKGYQAIGLKTATGDQQTML